MLDYVYRLAKLQEKVQDKIFIVPRLYTNKPRTIGVGYKGMLHQPSPEGEEDMLGGIIAIRKMNVRVVEETGLTGAEEILYPEVFRYLSDLLSYAAVGARSSEDQLHRMIASGVGIPVGMKNPTSGDLSVMLNSVAAALQNPAIIVDTNHANSGKKYLEQIRIAKDIVHSRKLNADINRIVKGLMIESYIEDGAQGVHDGVYGKSITDPCLGWEKTERLLLDLAEEL